MIETIVFLYVTPSLVNDEKKYSYENLVNKGYYVEIWDLTPVIEPEVEKTITKERFKSDIIKYKRYYNMNSVEVSLKEYTSKAFFLPMFDIYYNVRKLYGLFTKYNLNYGYVNNLCADIKVNSWKDRNLIKSLELPRIIYNRIIRKVKQYRAAQFIVHGSNKVIDENRSKGVCSKSTIDVLSHTFDYERFQNIRAYEGNPYCVFLDQFFPFHPDNAIQRGLVIDADKYYVEIMEILRRIREYYGLEIIIAAHPRADYSNKQYFDNYQVEYGKTAELVKGSTLVVGHFSNSLSFGVLSKTPIIIANTPTLKKIACFDRLCQENSKVYGAQLVTYACDIDGVELGYDEKKYEEFIREYMICDTDDDTSIWDKVLEEIDKINESKIN